MKPVPRSYLTDRRTRSINTRRCDSMPPRQGLVQMANMEGTIGRVPPRAVFNDSGSALILQLLVGSSNMLYPSQRSTQIGRGTIRITSNSSQQIGRTALGNVSNLDTGFDSAPLLVTMPQNFESFSILSSTQGLRPPFWILRDSSTTLARKRLLRTYPREMSSPISNDPENAWTAACFAGNGFRNINKLISFDPAKRWNNNATQPTVASLPQTRSLYVLVGKSERYQFGIESGQRVFCRELKNITGTTGSLPIIQPNGAPSLVPLNKRSLGIFLYSLLSAEPGSTLFYGGAQSKTNEIMANAFLQREMRRSLDHRNTYFFPRSQL